RARAPGRREGTGASLTLLVLATVRARGSSINLVLFQSGSNAPVKTREDDRVEDTIEVVRRWVDAARAVVVLTGAGISTDSGIPDFRGPNGVWTKNPAAEKTATLQHYLADPDVRRQAWRSRLDSPAWHAQPNAGHRAIVTLERRGKLHTLITQNVDGLHL